MRANSFFAGLVLAVVGLFFGAPASAEDQPKITIVSAGVQRLRDDLKYLVSLAPTSLQKQWETLDATLQGFEQGVSQELPIRLDLVLAGSAAEYQLKVPVAQFGGRGGFEENLESFGYTVTEVKNAPGLFELKQTPPRGRAKRPTTTPAAKPYFMRLLNGVGFFAETQAALPANLPGLTEGLGIAELVTSQNVDVAAQIENPVEGLEQRRTSFRKLREQLEAAIKFKRGESEDDFALRKVSSAQSFNEAERFLLESQLLKILWTTDVARKSGLGELTMSAIGGTSLAESIQLLCQQPGYFENVTLHDDAVFSGKIHFAIDPMRSQHAADLYPKLLRVLQAQMDSRPNLNDEGKAAAKDGIARIFEMLTEALPLKRLEAMVDLHRSSGGKHTGVVGIRAADGTKAAAALALLPIIRSGWKWQAETGTHEGATLHQLTVAPHRMKEFEALFGGEAVIHVATDQDAVWAASGVGSLDALKTAITEVKAAPPASPSPVFLNVKIQFEPLIQVLDVLASSAPPPATPLDKAAQLAEKQRTRLRKLALEAFKGGEARLEAKLEKQGDEVRGQLSITEGVLRFVGGSIADFAAENLQ
jgi:hypothetical protein